VPGETGWVLPEFVPKREIYHVDLVHAGEVMQAQLGGEFTIRYAVRVPEPAIPGPLNVYVVEPVAAGWTPPAGSRWLDRAAVDEAEMPLPRQRNTLRAWFQAEAGEEMPSLSFPWWDSGWFAVVSRWLGPLVEKRGYTATGPPILLKSSFTSAIVRVPAGPADLYLKMTPPSLAPREAELVPVLAAMAERRLPTVVAVDPAGSWMLTREMAGRAMGSDLPIERWEKVVRTYAELQLASMPHLNQWLALGCPDLRLERFEEEFVRLVREAPERLRGSDRHLTEEEQAQLGKQTGRFLSWVADLTEYGLPACLEHGDLHWDNIRVTDDGYLFFDWSGACVTHPFFGLGDLLADDDWFPGRPDLNDRIRDAYLSLWTEHAPIERLQAAYEAAQRLRPLYSLIRSNNWIAAYQAMLGGREYVRETPTGVSINDIQWGYGIGLRSLFSE
jgi:hypothetical protein